jgi:hypothetical protein
VAMALQRRHFGVLRIDEGRRGEERGGEAASLWRPVVAHDGLNVQEEVRALTKSQRDADLMGSEERRGRSEGQTFFLLSLSESSLDPIASRAPREESS